MPRAVCNLVQGRPTIEIVLTGNSGTQVTRTVLADTGAGVNHGPFEILLDAHDCLVFGGMPIKRVYLRGAFSGWCSVYTMRIQIPQIGFDDEAEVVAASPTKIALDGIAGFRFLNRFRMSRSSECEPLHPDSTAAPVFAS